MSVVDRVILVGFDSAWTDNPGNPGGICAMEFEAGRATCFHPPRLARFDEAAAFVADLGAEAALLLVAVDQPTVVPNMYGARPVDRIAGSLISRLRGGVQPAFRSGSGARMFGDDAPIWRFLDVLALDQDPERSRTATTGRFAIEVFPALALPSFAPDLLARRRGAKYNPAVRRHFLLDDWHLVCGALRATAEMLGLDALSDWAVAHQAIAVPRKSDQDRLDSALCLAIAAWWRLRPPEESMIIGDVRTDYVVTPAIPEIRTLLETAQKTVWDKVMTSGVANVR